MTKSETKKRLLEHFSAYPLSKAEDIFKYLYHSTFGCEHLMLDEEHALEYIKNEYRSIKKDEPMLCERLDGEYYRVHLSCLNAGLNPKTLLRMFALSAKKNVGTSDELIKRLSAAEELIINKDIPVDPREFAEKKEAWALASYPPIHHSEVFRTEYRPAYRVIHERYAKILPILTEIDRLMTSGPLVIAIDGGSASGKSTLADILEEIYDATLLHMDDFFLRPHQRTEQRYEQIGANVDHERFLEEVLIPLKNNRVISYVRFDCATRTLCSQIKKSIKNLTVIEGCYSMHQSFNGFYDFGIFLDIDKDLQRKRILKRNAPEFAKRFFEEWIPLEDKYFSATNIKERADLLFTIEDK